MKTSIPTFTKLAPGLWLASKPVSILGMPLSATMALVEIAPRELLAYSPTPLTPERRAFIDRLGRVTEIYAPNTFHHQWTGDWVEAFPAARVHAPLALRTKRPDLRIDRHHDGANGPLNDVLTEIHVGGFLLEESVLVHRPSGTLIVADLVHHIGRPDHLWTKVYAGAMGFYDRVAISRMIRWTSFPDRAAARESLRAIERTGFDRLVVGHGAPIAEGAHAPVMEAYAWLDRGLALPAPPSREPSPCG
jgi:hypothetical protein